MLNDSINSKNEKNLLNLECHCFSFIDEIQMSEMFNQIFNSISIFE